MFTGDGAEVEVTRDGAVHDHLRRSEGRPAECGGGGEEEAPAGGSGGPTAEAGVAGAPRGCASLDRSTRFGALAPAVRCGGQST